MLSTFLLILSLLFQSQEQTKAKVYVYQLRHVRTIGKVAPAVWLDDKIIAKLDGTRYFVVNLEPGHHIFRLTDKKRGGIEMDFKAGETYYIRMEMKESDKVGATGLTLVPIENATYEMKQMRPIVENDIRDPSVVSVP